MLRPFLGISKAEILGYLERRSIPYSTDSTNLGDAYARNRLRHGILPLLSAAIPGWQGGLLETARKALAEDEALSLWVSRVGFVEEPEGRLSAPASLLNEPNAIRERALIVAAAQLSGAARISSRFAGAAMSALSQGAASYRGAGFFLERKEGRLYVSRSLDFPRPGGYFVEIDAPGPSGIEIHVGHIFLRAFWTAGPGAPGIREGAFSFPLIVRSRRPGDALPIRGGRKPLDELFTEWGLQGPARDRVPVVEDEKGIVAVLGAQYGCRDRYRPSAERDDVRALFIQVKGA